MAKVAIVGGGAAGTGAAIALAKAGMEVSLFEAEAQLGGNCFAVSVPLWDRRIIRIDAGVSEFNRTTSSSFSDLIGELDLRCDPANRELSFMTPDRAAAWFTRGGQPQFRRPLDDQKKFIDEIDRFERTCIEVLDEPAYEDWSAQRYLLQKQYSGEFRRFYFDPRAQGSFAMPDMSPRQYPIRSVVTSWRMQGIVGSDAAEHMVVQGGMHTYFDAVERWLRERKVSLHLSTQVVGISRLGSGVRLRAIDRDMASLPLLFDHVIIATGASQVIPLLEDATPEEARIYSQIECQRSRLVVHQDPRLMPADRAAWGAYNYLLTHGEVPDIRPTVTLYPNRLQNLPASIPDVFVTINPFVEPDADKILSNRFLDHPVIGGIGDAALQELDAMQGKRRTWFCGSYLREPFLLEQAHRCGLETAERLLDAVADESLKFETGIAVSLGGFDSFLREIPLFADLDARALSEVQLVARPFHVDAGTVLFRQDDPSDGLYLIKHGEIAILRRVLGDRAVNVATLGPRAVVGEMSLLDHNRRSAHAVAVSPSSGYFVSSERFQLVRSDYRPAAFAVMSCFRREVAGRARAVIDEIAARAVAADAQPAAPISSGAARWPAASSPSTVDEGILHSLPFFKTFKPAELREFVEPLKRYDFSRGEVVYAGGEAPRGCLLIVRGALSMNFSTTAGTTTFSVHGPGKMVGVLPLLDGGLHPLACLAREETIAFEIDRFAFEILRRGGSVVAFKFFEAVTSSIVALLRKATAHKARIAPDHHFEGASISSSLVSPTSWEPN